MKKLLATLALLAACQLDSSDPVEPAPAAVSAPRTNSDTAATVVDDECTTPDRAAPAPAPAEAPADPRVRRGAEVKQLPPLPAPAWTPPPVAPEVLAAQRAEARAPDAR